MNNLQILFYVFNLLGITSTFGFMLFMFHKLNSVKRSLVNLSDDLKKERENKKLILDEIIVESIKCDSLESKNNECESITTQNIKAENTIQSKVLTTDDLALPNGLEVKNLSAKKVEVLDELRVHKDDSSRDTSDVMPIPATKTEMHSSNKLFRTKSRNSGIVDINITDVVNDHSVPSFDEKNSYMEITPNSLNSKKSRSIIGKKKKKSSKKNKRTLNNRDSIHYIDLLKG